MLSPKKMFSQISKITKFAYNYKVRYNQLSGSNKILWWKENIESLGPTYVKIGQFMSNRSDLLSDQDLKCALQMLHDNVAPLEWECIHEIIKMNYDNDTFTYIDVKPLASASIGQVHRATLKNGDNVVLKIRRPNIGVEIGDNILMLEFILNIIKKIILLLKDADNDLKSGITDLSIMLDDVKQSILRESSMLSEVANLKKFENAKIKNTLIPCIYDELSNDDILIMSYVPSIKISDAYTDKEKKKKLAAALMDSFIRQFLFTGIIHGDPHPGNVALSPDKTNFVMYDFGHIVELDADTMNIMKLLVFELMSENVNSVMRLMTDIPDLVEIRNETGLTQYIRKYIAYIKTIDVKVLKELTEQSSKINMPFKFSGKIFEIIRIFGIVEGICLDLDPEFSYDDAFSKYANKLFNDEDFLMLKSKFDLNALIDMF